jgi:F-type H+-transporting ATPase subunit delta
MASMIERYVNDLFDYAVEHNQLENYHRYALLYLRGVGGGDIEEMPDELYSFLKILPDDDINAVITKFFEMAGDHLGLLDVKIFSAVRLTFKQWSNIEKQLVAMFGKEINLVMKEDKSLIGGLRIVVGHTIIDNTIKTRLAEMKKNVYKEVYLNQ